MKSVTGKLEFTQGNLVTSNKIHKLIVNNMYIKVRKQLKM